MTDRPILFSAPMVCALLYGRKAQTRRVIADGKTGTAPTKSPRFCIGDRLWVREAWHAARSHDCTPPRDIPRDADIEHAATARSYAEIGLKGKLRPGMFMPRWASRLTLQVTDVRVQRLQDITEQDALAEGCFKGKASGRVFDNSAAMRLGGDEWRNARDWFADLWDSINAARGFGWEENPFVVAVSFTVERGNIDGTRDDSTIMVDSNGPYPSGRPKDRAKP